MLSYIQIIDSTQHLQNINSLIEEYKEKLEKLYEEKNDLETINELVQTDTDKDEEQYSSLGKINLCCILYVSYSMQVLKYVLKFTVSFAK